MASPNNRNLPAGAIPAYLCTGGGVVPLGYQQLMAAELATAQNLSPPAGAVLALIVPEVEAVRWRDDGTAPTTTVGMLLSPGLLPFVYTADLSTIEFIAASSGAILNVSYY